MKRIFETLAICLALGMALSSCQKWEEYNTDPFGVTEDMLAADYNNIGAYFPQIMQSVYFNYQDYAWEFQLMQNLTTDLWSGYMGTASAFSSNINTGTLSMIDGWVSAQWNNTYSYVMAPIFNSIEPQANNDDYYYFYAPALIIKVMAMHRVADAYGPVIYSAYGQSATGGVFDSVEEVYDHFFTDLDTALAQLDKFMTEFPGSAPFAKFDQWCGGDYVLWSKLANTIRLRLAMHIVKADPAKAKAQAEKAIANKYGVLEGNEVVQVKASTWAHPLNMLTEWKDIYMGAVLESLLTGYDDPRAEKFFTKTSNPSAVEAGLEYASIRMGIDMVEKAAYDGYSSCAQGKHDPGILCTASEAYFLRAEGVLRGWNMGGGSAKEFYESGVRSSFEYFGCSGVEEYLQSNAVPADHKDPVTPANDIKAANTATPKWNDAASNEEKLEKIVIQKYIAGYPESYEAWTTLRRTGYPKQFPVIVNHSNGILGNDDIVRRMPYPSTQQTSNPEGYSQALSKLGGNDNAATRLWWDIDKPNF